MISTFLFLFLAINRVPTYSSTDGVTRLFSSAATATNNSVAKRAANAGPTQNISGDAAWATPLAGSSWISYTASGDNSNPEFRAVPRGTTVTFEQTFTLTGNITSAYLIVRANDTTSVVLNGTTIYAPGLKSDAVDCSSAPAGCVTSTQGVFSAAQLVPYLNANGVNTIDFTVLQKTGGSFGLNYSGTITTEPFAILPPAIPLIVVPFSPRPPIAVPEPDTLELLGVGVVVGMGLWSLLALTPRR